ncbi:MAG: tetratricopeptide repeat protein [Alphaproteobacteria bacterium]|nr:tetratricopeptide repeat protein [Alphaproteobacteria bacterium]
MSWTNPCKWMNNRSNDGLNLTYGKKMMMKFHKKTIATLFAGAFVFALGAEVLNPTNSAQAMSFGGATPDLMEIQKVVDKGMYDTAIKDLQALLEKDNQNADAWNLLGFSYRKSGELDLSWDAYERALTLKPDHLGANEYLGELYIAQGNMDQANVQLEKLMLLCPSGCEAYDNLKAAIAKAGQ